jgi:hypothetical protein
VVRWRSYKGGCACLHVEPIVYLLPLVYWLLTFLPRPPKESYLMAWLKQCELWFDFPTLLSFLIFNTIVHRENKHNHPRDWLLNCGLQSINYSPRERIWLFLLLWSMKVAIDSGNHGLGIRKQSKLKWKNFLRPVFQLTKFCGWGQTPNLLVSSSLAVHTLLIWPGWSAEVSHEKSAMIRHSCGGPHVTHPRYLNFLNYKLYM